MPTKLGEMSKAFAATGAMTGKLSNAMATMA
jgi:hypothetical protein